MNPPFCILFKNVLSPCIGRTLDSSTSAGSSRGAIVACLPSAGSLSRTGMMAAGSGDGSRKNLRVGVINEIHKLTTQINNDEV